jgi:hypothetical protein
MVFVAKKKNKAAAELGRKGGQRKVPKGLAMLSDDEKRAIALKGVAARRKKAKERERG